MFELDDSINNHLSQIRNISQNPARVNGLVIILSQRYKWIADDNDIYVFTGNYYHLLSESEFSRYFSEYWRINWNNYCTGHAKEAYKQLRDKYRVEPNRINNYPNYVPFLNGLFNIITMQLESGSPDLYITNPIPFNYTNGNCPLFRYAMQNIFPDELKRNKVLCFIAYCLTNSIHKQIAQLWVGPPKSGKTTLAEFIRKLQPNAVSSIPFKDIVSDKGAICGLKGKRLNISSEIGGSFLKQVGIDRIKALITVETLNGRDAYRRREEWLNITKFIFTSNNLPSPHNADKAFYRRFQFIEFSEDFTGREDPTLFNDILENEAPQVISYILSFLPKVDELFKVDIEEMEKKWNQYSNSLQNYFNERIQTDENSSVDCTLLYNDYVKWCNKKNQAHIAQEQFGKIISYERMRTSRGYMYKGIKLKFLVEVQHI